MAKSIEEIKERLKKLYSMMDEDSGACESEVQSALKAARKLMAEYKLSEADFLEKKLQVIKKCLDIKFSTTTNPWILTLNKIIANNYCCNSVMYTEYHSKIKKAGLIGFEDDVELAEKVMHYAVDCIEAEQKRIRAKATKQGYSYKEASAMCNAYGNGYVRGIREAFEEQNKTESESFAMVMVTPEEVNEVSRQLQRGSFNTSKATSAARRYDEYAVAGFAAGKNFNPTTRLVG